MGAHGAADEDGLADHLVVDGDEWVVGRERARATLAVHQQLLGNAVDQVLLHLSQPAASCLKQAQTSLLCSAAVLICWIAEQM